MSFPATWFVLPHVRTTGNQGSHPAACADPQGRGLFRRRQLEYRPVRTHDVRDLQRRDLSALPEATAAPTNTRTAHDSHTRQCSLPSRDTPCPVPTPARPTPASPVPATVRPQLASIERVWKLTRHLATHTRSSPRFPTLSKPSMPASIAGVARTTCGADHAALLKTLCLVMPDDPTLKDDALAIGGRARRILDE